MNKLEKEKKTSPVVWMMGGGAMDELYRSPCRHPSSEIALLLNGLAGGFIYFGGGELEGIGYPPKRGGGLAGNFYLREANGEKREPSSGIDRRTIQE